MKHGHPQVCSSIWSESSAPFSFLLDGTRSDTLLPSWDMTEETDTAEGGTLQRRTYTDPASGLSVTAEIRSFDAFPAVEWVLYFENHGDGPTPILEDILPMDLSIPDVEPRDSEANMDLHYAKGSTCTLEDFLPLHTRIGGRRYPKQSLTLSPHGGRSSDGVLPFMNLQTSFGGLVLGIGWTGQWQAEFKQKNKTIQITAGMEQTHLRLMPGERIRTPRILLINWEGDEPMAGNNLLRQLILEHYTPRLDGEVVIPPIAHNSMYSHWLDKSSLTVEGELTSIAKEHDLGIEAHWVDACWFANGNWQDEVGDWSIRRAVFPDGLKPLGDAIHDNGMQFILWFEPERVSRQTPLAQEHPEWMLDHEGAWCCLLNLGDPEARAHITDLISSYIDEFGVDVYRQDFNMPILPFWQNADTPDRVGMTEIRYVEGLYAFWDALRQRHPHLAIDNCASGGRRIDLETTARSYPLWRSDFSDVSCLSLDAPLRHVGAQSQTAGLSRWVPLHAAAVWSYDPYEFRSAMSSGVVPYSDIRADDFPDELAKQAIAEVKRLRPYFLGDFYPLLSLTATNDQWCAYQYHRPDLDAGFAVFLRRHESPITQMDLSGLQGIAPSSTYSVGLAASFDDPPRSTMSGQELLETMITITEQPGSMLLVYNKV